MNIFTGTEISRLDVLAGGSSKVAIFVHTHPDGDALGSGMALAGYLSSCRGRQARVILPDTFPYTLGFLADSSMLIDSSEDMAAAVEWIRGSDLLVCLDMSTPDRAAGLKPYILESDAKKVLIDHHLNPDREIFDLVFSSTEISSTCELLYHILVAMPDIGSARKLPRSVAGALMAGMTTDTNNFANSVFPSTLSMASELLEAGVDRDMILGRLYNEYRENRFRAMGHFLGELMHITPLGVAYAVLDRKDTERFGLLDGETEGFVNIPLGISSVNFSIFLREDDGFFRVSIRSRKGFSSNLLAMRYFNGGGHENASGGRLYIPGDIASADMAAQYIENSTARFLQGDAGRSTDERH